MNCVCDREQVFVSKAAELGTFDHFILADGHPVGSKIGDSVFVIRGGGVSEILSSYAR